MDTSIALSPELMALIQAKIRSGRYMSASDVVGEALRLLDNADQPAFESVEAVREAWRRGVESGDAGTLVFDELRMSARQELATRKG